MKNIKIKFKILILFIFVMAISINVQAGEYVRFNNLSIEDGLSQGTVDAIFQDSKGYLWFGSNNGLNRYNGYSFKIYRNELGNENSLASDYIFDITEDDNGDIWVATMVGVSKINSNYEIANYYINGDEGINVSSILVQNNKNIVAGTGDGIYVYDSKIDKFIYSEYNAQLTSTDINGLATDKDDNIWAATKEGLNKIDLQNGQVTQYLNFNDNHLHTVYCEENSVWVGSYESGAYKLDLDSGAVINYVNNESEDNSIAGNLVKDFMRDSKGQLWIATSGGVSKLDEVNNCFINYSNKNYDSNSLVNNKVNAILEDNTGNFWAGTYSGISCFNPYSKISHYKSNPFDSKTLSDDMMKGLYEDDYGNMWIGTNDSGVDIFNEDLEKIYNLSTSSELKLSSNVINGINGYKNYIFLSTNTGLNILDINSGKIYIFKKENGLAADNTQQSLVDSRGYLWVISSNGVNIIDSQGNIIRNLDDIYEKYEIKNKYTRVIFEDSKENIWIGSFVDGGLIKINLKTGEMKNYKTTSSNLSSNTIRCMAEDEEGNLWIGTSIGLNKYSYATGEITVYTSNDGLPNNTIYGVVIDEDNNPWVSTNLGISKYNVKKDVFINYSVLDGLQSNEFNGLSYLKRSNGEIIFGGINGLSVFNPKDLDKNAEKPVLLLDQIKVSGIPVNSIQGKALKSTDNNIALQFFASDFKNTLAYKYYYKLEGEFAEWRLLDSNAITFSNLSPGKYKYKFKVMNSTGVYSDEIDVEFTIKQVWWKSRIAVCIYIVVVLFIIINYRMKVKILNMLVEQKTKKLKIEMDKNIDIERKKNNYFVNLSHELRTPLNVISSTEQLIRILNKNGISKEKLDEYMDILRRNSKRLLNIINDIIDTSKIENGNYKLDIKDNDIVYIVEESVLSLKEYIEGKGVELIIDPEVEEKIIKCDAEAIERCVINLVSNAGKFTKSGESITVNIKDDDNKIIIEVVDTGIGIDKKYHETIFERFDQVLENNPDKSIGSGLGLTITKQIIELHNGEIFVESEVGEGSKFTIILPIDNK